MTPLLNKLFNRNNLKVSNNYTNNIRKIISNHNRKVQGKEEQKESEQTCRKKCLLTDVVNEAVVISPTTNKASIYIGATQQPIKNRIAQHKLSFRDKKYCEKTTLAKHMWSLKEKHKSDPEVKWKIIKKAPSHKGNDNPCILCLQEKLKIAEFSDPEQILN